MPDDQTVRPGRPVPPAVDEGATTTRVQAPGDGAVRSPWLMLALATIGFAVNFWAWALISPLGPAVPRAGDARRPERVRRRAAGRRAGGRRLAGPHPRRCADRPLRRPGDVPDRLRRRRSSRCCSSAFFGHSTPTPLLLVGGFFLGIAGTAFAVGVPFVNAWFPPERRGLAVGIFGAGMGGTAISALTTVKLFTQRRARRRRSCITAVVLAVYAVVAWLVLRDAPGPRRPDRRRWSTRLAANARLPITWQACIALRGRLRRLRRLLGLPAGLPQDRLRADPGRRRQPDGRLRRGRRPHAAGRRLALRPVRAGPGAGRRRSASSPWARRSRPTHPAARARRHGRLPGHGRGPRRRQRRHVRPDRAGSPTRPGSAA